MGRSGRGTCRPPRPSLGRECNNTMQIYRLCLDTHAESGYSRKQNSALAAVKQHGIKERQSRPPGQRLFTKHFCHYSP